MKMADQKVIRMAETEGFQNWLDPEGNKGWHTCLLTGKKIRGQEAKDMISYQEEVMTDWEKEEQEQANQEEAEVQEEKVVGKYDAIAEELADRQARQEAEALAEDSENEEVHKEQPSGEDIIKNLDSRGIEASENLRQYIRTHGSTKTVVIDCQECDKQRLIKVQDKFQVTRCVACQKKERNRKRAQRRKEKRQQEKQTQEA